MRRRCRKPLLRVDDLDAIAIQTIDDINAPVKEAGDSMAMDSPESDVLEDLP